MAYINQLLKNCNGKILMWSVSDTWHSHTNKQQSVQFEPVSQKISTDAGVLIGKRSYVYPVSFGGRLKLFMNGIYRLQHENSDVVGFHHSTQPHQTTIVHSTWNFKKYPLLMLLMSSFRRDLLFILLPLVVDCCSYITIRTSHDMIYQLKFEKDYNEMKWHTPNIYRSP